MDVLKTATKNLIKNYIQEWNTGRNDQKWKDSKTQLFAIINNLTITDGWRLKLNDVIIGQVLFENKKFSSDLKNNPKIIYFENINEVKKQLKYI